MRGQLKLTAKDKEWAHAVKTRDGYRCVICGSDIRPNAHHLIPREVLSTKFDIKNGITLCPKHHFFSRDISAHNHPLALFMWMEEHRPEQLEYIRLLIRMHRSVSNVND